MKHFTLTWICVAGGAALFYSKYPKSGWPILRARWRVAVDDQEVVLGSERAGTIFSPKFLTH
jgi:hypothetical protein